MFRQRLRYGYPTRDDNNKELLNMLPEFDNKGYLQLFTESNNNLNHYNSIEHKPKGKILLLIILIQNK